MEIKIKGVLIHISFWFVSLISLYILLTPAADSIFLLLAAMLHEIGHLFVLFVFNEPPASIELRSFGIRIRRRNILLSSQHELLMLLGGPLVNLFSSLLFFIFFGITRSISLRLAAQINLLVAAFNLFPVGCLDGGNILRCLLEMKLYPSTAHTISIIVGIFFLLPLTAVGTVLFLSSPHSPSLLITAFYLMITLLRNLSG